MTEQEWLTLRDPEQLLLNLPSFSERKTLLFGCVCCHHVAHLMTDERSRRVALLCEQFLDGQIDRLMLDRASKDAGQVAHVMLNIAERAPLAEKSRLYGDWWAASVPASIIDLNDWEWRVVESTRQALDHAEPQDAASTEETSFVVIALIRHVFGNPFRPYRAPSSWPASVTKLAQATYDQEPVSFALHDALLEAGHVELAEHFKEPGHPKGCWALDAILGKS